MPPRRRLGRIGIGFGRGVHDVADALHREIGLLELLPQADQAQHRLGQPAGEHLEGDQHADGEVGAVHDGIGADAQDRQGQRLLQTVGDDVVGVADLANLEAGAQVVCQVVAVASLELRFHLQRLHRLQARDVFGDERLVAGAEQELLIEPLAEDGGHDEAQDDDDADQRQRDEGEVHVVVEHDRRRRSAGTGCPAPG